MDATNSFFPMDLSGLPMQADGISSLANTSPPSTQSNANAFSGSGGVFMGVSKPQHNALFFS